MTFTASISCPNAADTDDPTDAAVCRHALMFWQVYEVLVPTDDDKFLRQALHMLAEFATEIRCSPEDLAKERGAVLEVGQMANFHPNGIVSPKGQ